MCSLLHTFASLTRFHYDHFIIFRRWLPVPIFRLLCNGYVGPKRINRPFRCSAFGPLRNERNEHLSLEQGAQKSLLQSGRNFFLRLSWLNVLIR